MEYRVELPDFDDYEWAEIEAKGWLEGVRVIWGDKEVSLAIFDEVRLAQEIGVDLRAVGYFAARSLVVIPSVTKDEIERAVGRLAKRRFLDV